MTTRKEPVPTRGTLEADAPQHEGAASAVRVVTAAALYDGHDAAINLFRRLLVRHGAEVIHLGHNRAAGEVARAAIEEDADAVAVSSYQGGHMEFYPYLRRLLDDGGGRDILVFAGGGGVILPREAALLEASGVAKVFTPEDGRVLGLDGIARSILEPCAERVRRRRAPPAALVERRCPDSVARALSFLEAGGSLSVLGLSDTRTRAPVVGITGTGGAGKSSLVDEILLRLVAAFPGLPAAVLAVDPSKRRGGGALLGDRLRINSAAAPGVFLRSFASREGGAELSPVIGPAIELLRRAGYELIVVETVGIGQGASAIVGVADVSVYVMTSDFGGPTQLEKIDMLDHADLVAVNKADRRGAVDAVREVSRYTARGRGAARPVVVATSAGRFNDAGVNTLFAVLVAKLAGATSGDGARWSLPSSPSSEPTSAPTSAPTFMEVGTDEVIPRFRELYLGEAAQAVRAFHRRATEIIDAYETFASLERAAAVLAARSPGADGGWTVPDELKDALAEARGKAAEGIRMLAEWEAVETAYRGEMLSYSVRGADVRTVLRRRSLAGTDVPRVALPRARRKEELLQFLLTENLPGRFPFTAGVFPFKRTDELPTRQFAGEGPPERTNRRFHLLSQGMEAKRLSVAFDSVTLYGADPDERPDIYGKIGESGVSISTFDDMTRLFEGFDLTSPQTSVSMTINGPAPAILAMFFNAVFDQESAKFRRAQGREPDAAEAATIRQGALQQVRGTVQADILKEDQAQNTCIFSTRFALRLMGDVQHFFSDEGVRNFYSISVSGYHIAEAGANPITQLAFTLANGLTYVEYFRRRGLDIDEFAPNLSFFFSNGLDPEYTVLGRVARRVWAIVLRDVYGASERGQKLKYHIQTSGRSLHAREMTFNDIRTTLQALLAVFDHCNSLHTNAYDEAVTTPTRESVRRALAIQLILQREFGLAQNENPWQGSFIVEELTDLVEKAVLAEFDRISERGGVLGAMESGYLRGRIQDESLHYEELKHRGELAIIGVNTFVDPDEARAEVVAAVRATAAEKDTQIARLREFQARHRDLAAGALERLKATALGGGNIFRELMATVRCASLGQITQALFEVGGEYRRAV